jgi:hypothetical protein
MAVNENLMNTQTGGEGDTVQIQTQEQVTPEQFDVKIKAQVEPTEQPPVQPPVQREMAEPEVVGAQSTGGISDQEAFEEVPVSLPEGYPSSILNTSGFVDLDEDGNIIQKEEEVIETPYVSDDPVEIIDNPLPIFASSNNSPDYTFQNIPEEPLDKGVDNMIKFQSKFGLTEPIASKVDSEIKISNNSFDNPVASDFEKQITNGLDTDPESLKQAGIDFDLGSGTLMSKEELDKQKAEIREDVAESDLKLAKQKSLDEYYSLVEKKQIVEDKIKEAKNNKRKDIVSSLKQQSDEIDKMLGSLEKKDEIKELKKENYLAKKQLKRNLKKEIEGNDRICKNPKSPNYLAPGPCLPPADISGKTSTTDYTFYPDKWQVMDIFNSKSDYIARNVFGNRLQFDKGKQVSSTYGDKIQSASDASTAVMRLFASEGDIEYYKSKGLTREQAIAKHTQNVISEYNFTPSELQSIDKLLKQTVNWARADKGVYVNGENAGKFKAALLPNWGVLTATPITLENGQTLTLFKGIQEDEEQKKLNKNGYGISPWNKDSIQYKNIDINASDNDEYFVPPQTLSYWEKFGMTTIDEKGNAVRPKGDKFNRRIFREQKELLHNKDANGKPYLQGDDPIWGVGLTGVNDAATQDAKKRFTDDKAREQLEKNKMFSNLTGVVIGPDGKTYEVQRDNPFYSYSKTGKLPNVMYGNRKISDIPFGRFKSVDDAEFWASKNLPSNTKKISGINPSTLDVTQEDFRDYINGLDIGVNVVLEGGMKGGSNIFQSNPWDMNRVTIYPPAGVMAKPLVVDLGEGDKADYDRAEKLEKWLNSVQESPQTKFVAQWAEVFDPARAITRNGDREIGKGNQLYINVLDREGKPIDVTYGNFSSNASAENKLDVNKFATAINQEQNKIGERVKNLEIESKKYEQLIQPSLQKLEQIKKETKEKQAKVKSDLLDLRADLDKNLISDEEFSRKSSLLNDQMVNLQQNLNNAVSGVNQAYKDNQGAYDKLTEIRTSIDDDIARLSGISKDIDSLYGTALNDIKSNLEGSNTLAGHLASSFVRGAFKSVAATVNLMMDAEKGLGIIKETDKETMERKRSLYEDDVEEFLNYLDLGESEAYKNSKGTIVQALASVGESMGSLLNPVTRITAGTPLAKVGQVLGFATYAYSDIDKEVSLNPELADLSESQRKMITLPYAIGMGVLEDIGYGYVLKGEQSSLAKRVLTGLVGNALKVVPQNATLEVIEKVIKGEVGNKFVKTLSAIANSAAGGGEEEFISTLGMDIGWKNLMDYTFDKDVFNKDSTWGDYLKMSFDSYIGGAIGNAALKGTFDVVNLFSSGKQKEMTSKDYDFFRLTANDAELKKLYIEHVANRFNAGEIKKEEAEAQITNFENLAAIDRKISDQIDGDDRTEMVNLLIQKQAIQERMNELDDSQKGLSNPELENVDNRIKEIVTKTENRINEEKKNVEENQSRVSSEVGEGQESIETQPVVETSQEEVSPSGVVQEEQTEVTPTEEVETEPEKTTTTETITGVMTTGQTQLESDLIGQEVSTGKQRTTEDIQTGETVSKFEESRKPTKGKVVNVEADPRNKNVERLILEDGTVLNRNKNTGAITLNNQVKATVPETTVTATTTNEFDELAEINKLPTAKRTKAKNAFSEKYGDKADKIIKIDSNFTSIINKLETEKIIVKKC